jgi:hypothetical protein
LEDLMEDCDRLVSLCLADRLRIATVSLPSFLLGLPLVHVNLICAPYAVSVWSEVLFCAGHSDGRVVSRRCQCSFKFNIEVEVVTQPGTDQCNSQRNCNFVMVTQFRG